MEDLALLAVAESEEDLVDDAFDVFGGEGAVGLEDLLDVEGEVLEDEGEALGVLGFQQDLLEVDDVGVLELPQQEDLPQDAQ